MIIVAAKRTASIFAATESPVLSSRTLCHFVPLLAAPDEFTEQKRKTI
jgi:hypothetical protein